VSVINVAGGFSPKLMQAARGRSARRDVRRRAFILIS
jgi:hypothetical protein